MDEKQETGNCTPLGTPESRRRAPLPSITNAERAFWRRAVEIERSRQSRPRPAPFPFQPA